MWEDGIYVGIKGSIGETMVADGKGVWVTRTVRRKTREERRERKHADYIVGAPWEKQAGEPGGEDAKLEVRIMDTEYRERLELERDSHVAEPRRLYLRKEDFEVHGYTVNCPGCVSVLRGTARQAHTDACRRRMEGLLEGSARSMDAQRRAT